ncbi:MAG: polysaccharide deacetylase family protein, partial [Armatimonadetes bacterium]|nr:polysaccharide deacetylase family protein [Anaerolineae bacterium]
MPKFTVSVKVYSLCLLLLMLTAFAPLQVALQAQAAAPFRVYLTFEDGPTDAYTPGILDTLTAYNAKATFLIAGDQIAGHEEIIQREVREGHALVNHLWSEPGVYAGAPDADVIASYLRTEEAIRAALGDALPIYDAQTKLFWQPGGGAQPLPYIEGVQAITYNWNVNSDDCGWGMPAEVDLDTDEFDAAVIANVLGKPVMVEPYYNPYNVYDYGDGVVIAFHDLNRVTGRVLPTILTELQAAGATFEALPRPWDEVGTMPIALGAAPVMEAGVSGFTLAATTVDYARLRGAPSLDGDIITTAPLGTVLTAVGRAPGWIQVQHEGGTAWVARDLLTIKGAI